METFKAGCFLVDTTNKKVALVYRAKQKDYSFPKGHLEKGETFEQCAIRETEEETKRLAKIVKEYEPYIEKYTTPSGEQCVCYMYIAIDNGKSNNNCKDTHKTYWIPFDNVEQKLSYPSLKNTWNCVKDRVFELLK